MDGRDVTRDESGPGASAPRGSEVLRLLAILSATFMVTLDFFIVNVAAPSIRTDLDATGRDVQLIVAIYGLTYAAGLLLGGRLGDRFGRKRLFVGGMIAFAVASTVCGLAPDATSLIAARAAQGSAAAVMAPQVLALARTEFRGRSLDRAYRGYGVALGLGSGAGQLVGGALISGDVVGLGWRGCFLVNIPIALVAVLVAVRTLGPDVRDSSRRVDWVSGVQVTAAMTLVVLPLIEGADRGWPAWVWASFATSAVLGTAFVRRQGRIDPTATVVAPDLLRDRRFTIGLLTVLAFYAGVASFFLALSIYLQSARDLAPIESGLVFSLMVAGFLVTTLRPIRRTTVVGVSPLSAGALVCAAGHASMYVAITSSGTGGSLAPLVVPLVVVGAGLGMVMSPLVSTVLRPLDPLHAGTASGTLASAQQLGNSLGVAVLGLVFFTDDDAESAALVDALASSHVVLIAHAVIVGGLLLCLERGGRRDAAAARAAETGAA